MEEKKEYVMTFGEKLSRLRRENNYTQEQLAELMEVSRQTVSKWESDLAYPETEKLVKLGAIFSCTMDYLLKDEVSEKNSTMPPSNEGEKANFWEFFRFELKERKSEKTVWGMPLYHIGKNAYGFFAIGFKARGVFALGLLSMGLVSFGLLSLGLLAFGSLAVGLIALGALAFAPVAVGAIAFGLFAVGSISFGIVSFGALSIGCFSSGALSIGQYMAVGDHAYAAIAVGETEAVGRAYTRVGNMLSADRPVIEEWLNANVPAWLSWARIIFKFFIW